MAVPAVTIQLDELNRRNNRTLRWLYAALALMAAYKIYARYGAGTLSTDFSFFADVFTILVWGFFFFFFYTPKDGQFNHYLRVDDEGIKIKRPLRKRQVHPWADINRVEMSPLALEIHSRAGALLSFNFSDISYEQQQQLKPILVQTLTHLSQEQGFDFAGT